MKITQVIPTLGHGGAEKLVLEYSKRLSLIDQITIICLFDSSSTSNYHVLKKMSVKVIFLNKKKGLDFSIFYKIFVLLLKLKPDVVHSHLNSLKYLFPFLIFFSKKVKFFHTIHNQPEIDSVNLEKLVNKFIFKYFSVIPIALSKSLKEAVDKYYKINKCVPLNNGIDYNNYYFNQTIRDELRNKHDIQFDEIVIGHVGRFNTQKNHDFLIDILIDYNKTNTKFKAILLGDGVLMDKIKHKVLTNKLEDKVIFLGNINDVEKYYNMFDVYIFPSLYEGLSLSLIEAQVNNLPCLIYKNIDTDTIISNKVVILEDLTNIKIWSNQIRLQAEKRFEASIIDNRLSIDKIISKLKHLYELRF